MGTRKAWLCIVVLSLLLEDGGYNSVAIMASDGTLGLTNMTAEAGCEQGFGCDDLNPEENSTLDTRNDSVLTLVTNNDNGARSGGTTDDKIMHDTVLFICRLIISPPVNFLGILGNVLVLIALCKGGLKSPSVPYFIGLTLSDLLLLVFASMTFLASLDVKSAALKSFYTIFACYLNPLQMCFYTIGILVTVVFTVERYIAICHPITAQKLCTGYRAKVSVMCVYFFGFALNIPRLFVLYPVKRRDPTTNETFIAIHPTPFGQSHKSNMYIFWTAFIGNITLPFCVMTVLNSLIIRQLALSRKLRKSTSVTTNDDKAPMPGSRDGQITRTLLSISAMFFICNSCSGVSSVMLAVIGTSLYYNWKFLAFIEICNMLAMANSVFNCMLYTFYSHTIRQTVLNMVCSCCRAFKPSPSPFVNNTRA